MTRESNRQKHKIEFRYIVIDANGHLCGVQCFFGDPEHTEEQEPGLFVSKTEDTADIFGLTFRDPMLANCIYKYDTINHKLNKRSKADADLKIAHYVDITDDIDMSYEEPPGPAGFEYIPKKIEDMTPEEITARVKPIPIYENFAEPTIKLVKKNIYKIREDKYKVEKEKNNNINGGNNG